VEVEDAIKPTLLKVESQPLLAGRGLRREPAVEGGAASGGGWDGDGVVIVSGCDCVFEGVATCTVLEVRAGEGEAKAEIDQVEKTRCEEKACASVCSSTVLLLW
jgi:hypothetical protein